MTYEKETKELLSQIPQNAKVFIWGAANAGISIKEELETNRHDIKITGFIDASKTGLIDDIEIYAPEKLSTIKDKFDFMIISTRSDCTVIDSALFYYDINNYVRISNELLRKYQFLPSKFKEVINILEDKEDKELFTDLIEARITKNTEKLKQYVLDNHNITPDRKRTIKHYTSNLNFNAIEIILEGGMFNGLNTVVFKKLFKNLKKIYAFELIYEKVKNKTLDPIIKSLEELSIIELALWDCKNKLEFTENIASPYSSGINPPLNRNKSENSFIVDTISIDEFVQENSTPKIDFIKMDIEGAEMKALKGGSPTISNFNLSQQFRHA